MNKADQNKKQINNNNRIKTDYDTFKSNINNKKI